MALRFLAFDGSDGSVTRGLAKTVAVFDFHCRVPGATGWRCRGEFRLEHSPPARRFRVRSYGYLVRDAV